MESSHTRDRTCVLCTGRWIPNHWTTGSSLFVSFKSFSFCFFYLFIFSCLLLPQSWLSLWCPIKNIEIEFGRNRKVGFNSQPAKGTTQQAQCLKNYELGEIGAGCNCIVSRSEWLILSALFMFFSSLFTVLFTFLILRRGIASFLFLLQHFYCYSVSIENLSSYLLPFILECCFPFVLWTYWSGLPFPSPEDLPNPGTEPMSPALQADSLPTELWGKPRHICSS